MLDRTWLDKCASSTPHQPATALWRAVEIDFLLRHSLPTAGFGIDIGCGDGKIMNLMKEYKPHWDMIGIDFDRLETKLAKDLGIYIDVVTADGHNIPLSSRTFDFAISNSVLEHIPNIVPVLHEVARLLKPGAPFIFTVPSDSFHECLAGPSLIGRLRGLNRTEYLAHVDQRLYHYRYWSANEWEAQLKQAGFTHIRCASYLTKQETQRWELIANFTAEILFTFFKGKKQPIEIQRNLNLRRQTYPGWVNQLSMVLLRVLSLGLPDENSYSNEKNPFGCLLIKAQKE